MTNYNLTLTVDQTAEEVFAAIINPRGWWSEEIAGATDTVGAEFDYHFMDEHRRKIRVTELVPGERVGWLVLDNYFSFTTDDTEWKGTTITFDIADRAGTTELHFTHIGLLPTYLFHAGRQTS